MSLTRPMAIAHKLGSSRLARALNRKGAKASIYLWKSALRALAKDPIAAKAESATLDLAPSVLSVASRELMIRSA